MMLTALQVTVCKNMQPKKMANACEEAYARGLPTLTELFTEPRLFKLRTDAPLSWI